MTNNNKKTSLDDKVKLERKVSLMERNARSFIGKLNSALSKVGISPIDADSLIDGIKVGTITPTFITGVIEESLKIMGGLLKVASKGLKSIPVIGNFLSGVVKVAGSSLRGISNIADRVKD